MVKPIARYKAWTVGQELHHLTSLVFDCCIDKQNHKLRHPISELIQVQDVQGARGQAQGSQCPRPGVA